MHPSRYSVARPASLLAILALLAGAFVFAAPVAADSTLTAELTGEAEVPGPGDPDGSGTATVDITTESGEICVDLTWDITDATATAAHIHEAPSGEAGPPVLPLFTAPDDDGMFQGCFTDAALAADLEANPANYYVNIHSETYPDGAVRGQLAGPAAPATGMVMIMKHLCDPSIQTEADFQAVEARAQTNPTTPMGVPSLGATAETVLACPVVVQPGDGQTPGAIGSGSRTFDFTVTDSAVTTQTLTTDTTFSGDNGFGTAVEDFACESHIAYDADRDGTIEDNVCLDFSSYSFAEVVEGEVTVKEIAAPPGARFGTVRLTPAELSDDAAIGLAFTADGTITFDSSADEDAMVTLHVYNFQAAVAPEPTPAPPAPSQLPDTSADTTGTFGGQLGLLAGLAILTLGAGSMLAFRTASTRRTR